MKRSDIKEAESAISACEEETSVNISTEADIAYEAETANKAWDAVVDVAPTSSPFIERPPDILSDPVRFP